MARALTNKQLDIVVNEIYKQISEPIIKEHSKKLDEVKIKESKYDYFRDLQEYEKIEDDIRKLEAISKMICDKWRNIEDKEGFEHSYRMNDREDYIQFLKEKIVGKPNYPSKKDIECQVILAGNADIPEMIKKIIEYYK